MVRILIVVIDHFRKSCKSSKSGDMSIGLEWLDPNHYLTTQFHLGQGLNMIEPITDILYRANTFQVMAWKLTYWLSELVFRFHLQQFRFTNNIGD